MHAFSIHDVEQTKKRSHSSRVFLWLTCLVGFWCQCIWDFGDRTTNQARVRDTCLIVGLLPSIINYCFVVFMTQGSDVRRFCNVIPLNDSTSSRLTCFFVLMLVWFFGVSSRTGRVLEECNTSKTKSQRSRGNIPSMRKPASRDKTSDSVDRCVTEVCFSHIQLLGTNV